MQASRLVALNALVLFWCQFSATDGQSTGCNTTKMFNFETSSQTDCFQTSGSIATAKSSDQYKLGSHSLKVTVTNSPTPTPRLRLQTTIEKRELNAGGVKIWLYREAKRNEVLVVKFQGPPPDNDLIGTFNISLDFTGWRAIWVSYKECRTESNILTQSNVQVNSILLDFPVGSDTVYIDLFEMVSKLRIQSRDKIVPPFPIEPLYDTADFWQQTYKWSQQSPPQTPALQADKIQELRAIDLRLREWYADETKATYELTGYQQKRWESLLVDISKSYVQYGNLVKVEGIIKGPPLFSKNSNYGNPTDDGLKFGDVFKKLLLPLSLEYYLRTRDVEKTYILSTISGSLNSTNQTIKENAISLIAGNDATMKNTFRSSFNQTNNLSDALTVLNDARLQRILKIHDYLEDQGWADGSAVGSLGHEMNRIGAGMHSFYLLKTALQSHPTRLEKIINTTKWYTEFGEVYQSSFEFAGSTADRVKTLLLYRLFVILLMPDGAEKIRDIQAFQQWMDNALKFNKGFGGLIKPDFTGFHHKAFYATAYVPPALHTAALVYHLLGNSSYQMSSTSVTNLKNALETLSIVAVKYSVPVSVSGRYPDYFKKSLLNKIPSYAYMSQSYPNGLYTVDAKIAGTFGRLSTLNDSDVDEFMGDGKLKSKSFYMNSIGSLVVMDRVATASGRVIGNPPNGNWAKNFAALSIHRRGLWQVSVKGFNNYIWDFENSATENVFGLFQSHGAVQISNDQASLVSQDTSAGWKWMKVPGTTSIDLTLTEMKTDGGNRFFNPRPLAGGVTFLGSSSLANGLFGMDFSQPAYKKPMLKNIDFKFKKSVFFFENLLVCVGTGITLTDPLNANRKALTTLFQQIQVDPSVTRIKVNAVQKSLATPFSAPAFTNDTRLVDTNGNGFFIPSRTASSLKVEISDQTSRDDADKKDTSGRYSTAWLEHTQANSHYEYAVIINSDQKTFDIEDLATAQATTNKVYTVLQSSASSHVVKFSRSPETGLALTTPVFGYVIFTENPRDLPTGPIRHVNKPCLLMVEDDANNIKISISSPDLRFSVGSSMEGSKDVGVNGLYNFTSNEISIRVKFTDRSKKIVLKPNTVSWHGGVQQNSPPDVRAGAKPLRNGKFRTKAEFNNLANGFSVEAHFEKLNTPIEA